MSFFAKGMAAIGRERDRKRQKEIEAIIERNMAHQEKVAAHRLKVAKLNAEASALEAGGTLDEVRKNYLDVSLSRKQNG
jgi:hypothetical protein